MRARLAVEHRTVEAKGLPRREVPQGALTRRVGQQGSVQLSLCQHQLYLVRLLDAGSSCDDHGRLCETVNPND